MVRSSNDRILFARRVRLELEGLEAREVPAAVLMCEAEGSFAAIAGGQTTTNTAALSSREVPSMAGIDPSVLDFVFANAADELGGSPAPSGAA